MNYLEKQSIKKKKGKTWEQILHKGRYMHDKQVHMFTTRKAAQCH